MLRTCYRPQGEPGFTLVELMVVIGIISMTVSLLLPSLAKARQLGQLHKCQANLKTIWHGIFYYAEDESNGNGYLTQMSNSDGEPGTQQLYPGSWWAHQIQPYVEIKRTRAGSKQGILRCPADNGPEYYYVNAGDGLEWIIGARLYAPEDPILQKRILDQRAREGRTELHIEPISYGGSCDAKGTDVWYRDRLGKLVPLYETPPKLVNIVKPYCLGVLTDGLDGSDNPNCFRWALLVGAGQRRDFFMRHFGGEDPRNNGVNWLFADGHVQWHSAAYTSSRLVCCLADFGIARDNEKALIDSHCGR